MVLSGPWIVARSPLRMLLLFPPACLLILLCLDLMLCFVAITSSAKKPLMKLSVPRDGRLFEGKIADTMSKDAETRN